ncbi:hypothetical protein [Streptomyces sp. NPDC050560]|uniref:hypothetical protein n=1 Tax=Streptomyces sp. NPDC050560 TaxID=3365630 RepID=UPI0037AE38CC
MSRRVSLPGADELFRTTGGTALQASTPRRPANGEPRVPPPAGESDPVGTGTANPKDTAPAKEAPGGHGADDDGERTEHSTAEAAAAEPATRTEERPTDGEQPAGRAGRRQDPMAPPGAQRTAGPPGAAAAAAGPAPQQRRRGRSGGRRPSGRERHDEKITVYVSAEELMDLEHARLVLRGEHGLAVDRGRIVREAVAVVLADLESRGDASILVRRLRGR